MFVGTSLCIDTDLNESEKEFEAEFRKIYGDAESEKKAAAALAASEKQVLMWGSSLLARQFRGTL